jgi:hypothetical protein
MWTRRTARGRRAVLFALAAAGTPGMTLCALGMAADLPEPYLQTLLINLTANGRVRRLPGATTSRYQCTSRRVTTTPTPA